MTIAHIHNFSYNPFITVKSAIHSTSAKTLQLAKPIFKQMYQHPRTSLLLALGLIGSTPYPYNLVISGLVYPPTLLFASDRLGKELLLQEKEVYIDKLSTLGDNRDAFVNSSQLEQNYYDTARLDEKIAKTKTRINDIDSFLEDIDIFEEFLQK